MKLTISTLLAAAMTLIAANPLDTRPTTMAITSSQAAPTYNNKSNTTNSSTPLNYGAVLFHGLDMIDLWGPLDILQLNAHNHKTNLHLIAATLDPITTGNTDPSDPSKNKFASSFWPQVAPTATFADDLDLDVLIVPGGPGARASSSEGSQQPVIDYVRKTYPRVKHLITICTGASLAARAGVLDGKRATTSKRAWEVVTAFGPEVKWVAPARYVVDGNVWSSSGVTASLDLTYAFVEKVYGRNQSKLLANTMEHAPLGPQDDIFTDIWDVVHTDEIY